MFLNSLHSDVVFTYAVTTSGLDIVDLNTGLLYAYINTPGGFSAVWGNNDKIYLGTSSGTKYIAKTCLNSISSPPEDISFCLNDYCKSSEVRYIHGCGNLISVVTTENISITNQVPQGYTSTATNYNITKCFVVPNKLYYITSGTSWTINVLDYLACDWEEPSRYYTTGGLLASGIELNDIFVTYNTSGVPDNNTIFVATSSGVYIIDDGNTDYSIFYKML